MISHEGGFEFEWQGEDLVYRLDSCHPTFVWNVSHQTDAVTNFLPDADNVRRFIDRALTRPDEHTSVTIHPAASRDESVDELLGLSAESVVGNAGKAPLIIVTYDNPFLSPVSVTVGGRKIEDKDETIRVLNQRVTTLFDDREALVNECAALRDVVKNLEAKLDSVSDRLDNAIERLGGEKAIVFDGKIVYADSVTTIAMEISHPPPYMQPGGTTVSSLCFGMDMCPSVVKLLLCPVSYLSGNRFRVMNIHGQDNTELLEDILSEDVLGSEIRELTLRLHISSDCDYNRSEPFYFKLPLLPKLEELNLGNFKNIENKDCLDSLTMSRGLKCIRLRACDLGLPVLNPSVHVAHAVSL